jgi:AbiEi antitoxin C-terminal domain
MGPIEPWQISADPPHQLAKVRVALVAAGQFGRITHRQLQRLGVTNSTARDWRRAGYLHPRLPGVHAVGHPGCTVATELFEAVLYAGPGAMLSHTTAAWWHGLIDHPSPLTHVSTPRRRVAPRGIVIHGRRRLIRMKHNGIPVTTPEQTVFDLAAYCIDDPVIDDPVLVRVALAQLDYDGRYDPEALLALCRRGTAGSERLRGAIAQFDPRFALTRSRFERNWIVYCERTDTPKPDAINVFVHGIRSDNVYFAERLIVELDGVGNHRTPAQVRRDRRNDRLLRGHHWLVHRYSWADAPRPRMLSRCCAARWRSR